MVAPFPTLKHDRHLARRTATCLAAALVFVALLASCRQTPTPSAQSPTPEATSQIREADLSSLPAAGAGQAIKFRRLTLEDGLSQSTINCIVQDAQGFMWFGTEDGLNRYDGYTFKVYRNDPENPYSLSSNHVLGCMRTGHPTRRDVDPHPRRHAASL